MIDWKQVPGFDDYWVSNEGAIVSLKRGKHITLNPIAASNGYAVVKIGGKLKSIHRLVAQLFVPNSEFKPQVNHLDGNKHNNLASNLEWVTSKENMHHAMREGLHPKPMQEIYCVETGEVFESQHSAAKALNLQQTNISSVLLGKYTQTGGFTFRRLTK